MAGFGEFAGEGGGEFPVAGVGGTGEAVDVGEFAQAAPGDLGAVLESDGFEAGVDEVGASALLAEYLAIAGGGVGNTRIADGGWRMAAEVRRRDARIRCSVAA